MRDDDKYHDEFHPGVTRETKRRADLLLGAGSLAESDEKRDLSEDFREAELRDSRGDLPPLRVLVGRRPVAGRPFHVVLCRQELPDIAEAELAWRSVTGEETMGGRIQHSRRGRRAEDQHDDTVVSVARFYPA